MTKEDIVKVICDNSKFKFKSYCPVPMGEYLHFIYDGDDMSEEQILEMFEFTHCGKIHYNKGTKELLFAISNGSAVHLKMSLL